LFILYRIVHNNTWSEQQPEHPSSSRRLHVVLEPKQEELQEQECVAITTNTSNHHHLFLNIKPSPKLSTVNLDLMRILGVTWRNKISNEEIRWENSNGNNESHSHEIWLQWLRHVHRMDNRQVLSRFPKDC